MIHSMLCVELNQEIAIGENIKDQHTDGLVLNGEEYFLDQSQILLPCANHANDDSLSDHLPCRQFTSRLIRSRNVMHS